ncbi:energy transducer TonB [Psychrobacter urativorans]|uniref:energy transducer TonB n=1 Tax=Psychrobacter urativorans TaxID=45610 RepID=UPI001917DE92|nr:energy transducer TonB [Psychrobacter urativorans]
MGSTNFNAPPRKLTLIAIGAVVGLHLLTAMALVAMKPPSPIDEVHNTPAPIEIQMVTLPAEVPQIEQIIPEPVETEAVESEPVQTEVAKVQQDVEEVQENIETEPLSASEPESKASLEPKTEPEPAVEPKPEAKPEPVVEAKPEPETPPVVNTTTKTIVKETKPEKPNTVSKPKEIESEPFVSQNQPSQKFSQEPRVGTTTTDDQLRSLAAQEQDAARNAARKRARDAQADADARAKADAEAKADADASNTPVNFNASNANWAAAPNFSFPDRAKRSARSGDTFNLVLVLRVNKQGGIDSVSLAKSSGNAILDREAQRQVRSGKFRPFKKNGVPVVGNVTLPISYAVP